MKCICEAKSRVCKEKDKSHNISHHELKISHTKSDKLLLKLEKKIEYYSLNICFARLNIIIRSSSLKEEDHFEELTRYMKLKTCIIIKDGVEYWFPEKTLELARRWHDIEFREEDREERNKGEKENRVGERKYIYKGF